MKVNMPMWLERALGRMHREEGGAILLAALAACIIVFMLAMTLYEAGMASRDKVDVQTAADVAAYSQAAVKARAMNMIAFTNIAKRTVVGIHNMYWGQYMGYASWVASQCSACCCCTFTCCNCFSCKCRNCWGNSPLLLMEGLTDWMTFSGLPIVPLAVGGESESVYAKELEALSNYQSYMSDIAPWWAWSEQLVRGARNGATVTTSYPPPPDRLTRTIDVVDRILQMFGSGLWPQGQMKDGLPIERDDGFLANVESCSPPFPMLSIATPASLAEVFTNLQHYKANSSKGPSIACDGPGSNAPSTLGAGMAVVPVCFMSALLSPIADHMSPYFVSDTGYSFISPGTLPSSASDLMSRSNVIFAYRQDPEYAGFGRERTHALIDKDYADPLMVGGALANPTQNISGLWAFSRGEIVHPQPVWGAGPHSTWMWHPGWTAKLRPVVLNNEMTQFASEAGMSGAAFNAMYHDILPHLAGGAALMGLVGGNDFSFQQLFWDLIYMEKVSRTLDNTSANGLPR